MDWMYIGVNLQNVKIILKNYKKNSEKLLTDPKGRPIL